MKKEFTSRKALLVILLITGAIFAPVTLKGQVSHHVTASNYSFSPNELTINVGDTVIWKNTSGTHNVNGTTATYPSNPESFGNALGEGWTFTHVFKIAGIYDYRCDLHYPMGMTGKITVQQTTDAPGSIAEDQVLLYPNPASDYITVELQQNGEKLESVKILDLLGKELVASNDMAGSNIQTFDVSRFTPGVYVMRVETDIKTSILKFIIR